MIKKNTRKLAGIGLTILACSMPALSAEFDAVVRAGIGVSDNIGRSPVLEVEETMATFGFDFGKGIMGHGHL